MSLHFLVGYLCQKMGCEKLQGLHNKYEKKIVLGDSWLASHAKIFMIQYFFLMSNPTKPGKMHQWDLKQDSSDCESDSAIPLCYSPFNYSLVTVSVENTSH